ncbi:MAG: hypothetical protein ACREFP_22540 [Acetobacteraceae bacterium]
MANWDAGASQQLQELQRSTNAGNQDMDALRQQINVWANGNANGTTTFAFAPLRIPDARVRARTENGWIKSIQWGDKV